MMLTPTMYTNDIARLFSSMLASFAVYWGILKALNLFNDYKNDEI